MTVRPERPHRQVVSYVRRSARMNPSQRRALDTYGPRYLLDVARGPLSTSVAEQPPLAWGSVFGRDADLMVDIGPGSGDSLVAAAQAHPEANLVGFEVFEPSVAATVGKLGQARLANVRLVLADGSAGLRQLVPPGTLAEVRVFFPDPWHKTRHHKRRLVSPGFAALVASRLRPGGMLRLATDWEDYALTMREVLDASELENLYPGWAPRFAERPLTKYERRGLAAGRRIWDLCYRRRP
ncbi:MAG: tRNA (guanosine(46)-N7)-methyltransferase TrmB [Actinomycetia bacterium]|nr:tRNA (guanosine(46)-N7)-methyltransferase TrmB [Actinomycetes bacterium]